MTIENLIKELKEYNPDEQVYFSNQPKNSIHHTNYTIRAIDGVYISDHSNHKIVILPTLEIVE